MLMYEFFFFQKLSSPIILRPLSDAATDLKKVLSDKIPKEQERVKAFRKNHGGTKVGEVTVDMVRLHPLRSLTCSTQDRSRLI